MHDLGRKNKKLFLLDVFRKRLDYPDLKRAVWQLSARFQPRNILIEDKASGTQLIQELIRDSVHGVTRYEPTMDKIMRMHSVTSTFENGYVFLPTEAEWLDTYFVNSFLSCVQTRRPVRLDISGARLGQAAYVQISAV